MKTPFIILITFACFLINIDYASGQKSNDALFFLNLQQIDFSKVFINDASIESININEKTSNDEIYISTKNGEFNYYRLKDILKKYANINELNESVVFKINGRVIEDTTSIMIDDSYFIDLTIDNLKGVKYIPKKFSSLKIVNIKLNSKNPGSNIIIRGNEEILDKIKE